MVRGAGLRPGLAEIAGRHTEAHAGVGVANLQDRAGDGLSLSGDELELAVAVLGDAQHGHGAILDVELHAHAAAGLAVKELHPPQDGLLIADAHVPGAIVPCDDEAALKVEQVKLAEGASRAEMLQDEHGHAGLEIRLAGARDAPRGEERVAHDHRCRQALILVVVPAAIVVGQAVQGKVGGQAVLGAGHMGGKAQLSRVHLLRDAVVARRGHDEGLTDFGELMLDLGLRHQAHAISQVTHLQKLDVRPHLPLVHGEIGIHVQHPWVVMSQVAEAGIHQRALGGRSLDPFLDASPGALLKIAAHHAMKGKRAALKGAGYLGGGHRCANKGHVLRGMALVIHRGHHLQGQRQVGGDVALGDGYQDMRGGIGEDLADDEVHALTGKEVAHLVGSLGAVHQAARNDLAAHLTQLADVLLHGRHYRRPEGRKLGPIGSQAAAEIAHPGLGTLVPFHSILPSDPRITRIYTNRNSMDSS